MATTQALDVGKRETLVEAIAQALLRYIAANRLKGGDRLPSERELVEMVGASRLPLREALCILKGLGILEARHGKGIFVKPLDMAAIFSMLSPLLRTQADIEPQQIVEVRFHLETSIAELAAANRSEQNLRVLEESLAGMRANLHDPRNFIKYDMTFHQELARGTGNPIFLVFMASITDLLCEVQHMFPDKVEYRATSLGYHEQILDAVRTKDGGRARLAMQEHIHNVEERVLQ